MSSLLREPLPAETLVVAIDPGKVANRVWWMVSRDSSCRPRRLRVAAIARRCAPRPALFAGNGG